MCKNKLLGGQKMVRPVMYLIKEYNYDIKGYYYSKYQKGRLIRQYTYNEVEELRKKCMVEII